MADYLIHDSTLEDIADAIRAKTGDSASMTPAQMPTEIGNIPTGGGALPISISALDGGEFTLSSDTNSVYHIAHSLGVVPKGFVIWSDGVDISSANNNTIIRGVFVVDSASGGDVASYLYQLGVYNHSFNNYARWVGSNYSEYANASCISYNVSNAYYISGVKYKWVAWA